MSTRSGQRHFPYRRTRRSGNTSLRLTGRRRLRQPSITQASFMESDVNPGGCIDLTANDTLDGDIIDLTGSNTTVNSSSFDADPVVVISPTDVDNADAFRRESGIRRRLHVLEMHHSDDDSVIEVREPLASGSGRSSQRTSRNTSAISVEDNSDEDFPDVPFTINRENTGPLASPEPLKIICPVCMDSDNQIRQSRRQLYSTSCGHIFCSSCIKQVVEAQGMCPTCRKRLTKRQIHQIYL